MCQRMTIKVADMNFIYWIRRLLASCVLADRPGRADTDMTKRTVTLLRRFTANASKIRRDIPNAFYADGHIVG
jgi:hypothetical protein